MVNWRFIVSSDRLAIEGSHSFLITDATGGDGSFAAQVSPGFDHDVPRLTQILNARKGSSARPQNLPEPS